LIDDTDVDGDTLSVADASCPSNGTTTVPGNGTVGYAPASGYTGLDSFTDNASDGSLTAQASVDVTVEPGSGGSDTRF
jgi:hypothetical protein